VQPLKDQGKRRATRRHRACQGALREFWGLCCYRYSDGPTDLQFSRARPPARGCATRSVAHTEAARPPGQHTGARRLRLRVVPRDQKHSIDPQGERAELELAKIYSD
jgi:hypothetical protein